MRLKRRDAHTGETRSEQISDFCSLILVEKLSLFLLPGKKVFLSND